MARHKLSTNMFKRGFTLFSVCVGLMVLQCSGESSECTKDNLHSIPGLCKNPDFTFVDLLSACLFLIQDKKLTWKEADDVCKTKRDARLVIVQDQDADNALYHFLDGKLSKSFYFSWIGMREKPGGSFSWLDEKKRPPYYNWARGQPPIAEQPDLECVKRSSRNGKWTTSPCEEKHYAVCSRDVKKLTRPTLTTTTKYKETPLNSGDDISAQCKANAGKGNRVVFRLSYGPRNGEVVTWDSKHFENEEVKYFNLAGKGCRKAVDAKITFPVKLEYDGGTLNCCIYLNDGVYFCSYGEAVIVNFQYEKPKLKIKYHDEEEDFLNIGQLIVARCDVCAGGRGTGLTWVLKLKTTTIVWTITRDGKITKTVGTANNVCASFQYGRAIEDPKFGGLMNSTISFMVTEEIRGAILSCSSELPVGEAVPSEKAHLTHSRPFDLHYLAGEPQLDIAYNEAPDIVYTNTIMLINCTANMSTRAGGEIGGAATLAWTFEKGRTRHVWNIGLDKENYNDGGEFVAGVVVAAEVKTIGKRPQVKSQMEIRIGSNKKQFHGTIVACYSHSVAPDMVFKYTGADTFMRFSMPFHIEKARKKAKPKDAQFEKLLEAPLESASNPKARTDKNHAEDEPSFPVDWEDEPLAVVIFLAVLTAILGYALYAWSRLPREKRLSRPLLRKGEGRDSASSIQVFDKEEQHASNGPFFDNLSPTTNQGSPDCSKNATPIQPSMNNNVQAEKLCVHTERAFQK